MFWVCAVGDWGWSAVPCMTQAASLESTRAEGTQGAGCPGLTAPKQQSFAPVDRGLGHVLCAQHIRQPRQSRALI